MHFKRLVVAAAAMPLLYLYIMHLGKSYFFVLITGVSVLSLFEFYSMYRVVGLLKYAGILSCILIAAASSFSEKNLFSVIAASVMTLMTVRLMFTRTPLYSLHDLAAPIIGIIYIPCFITFQVQLREINPAWVIFLYATVWASDSIAYYIGKGIGRTKLYKEMSPNKTVAGAWGSVLGGMLGALLIRYLLMDSLSVFNAIIIGIIIGITTVIGDLAESMFKRDAGVKDSGILIPGHGGILDKMDGALFTGPVLYWLTRYIN